jgi:spermidine synthase
MHPALLRLSLARCIVALLLLCAGIAGCASADTVLFEGTSRYNGSITVTESADGVRTLRFADRYARQSVVKPGDPDYIALPYIKVSLIALALCKEPRRILVVGLGGGTLPRFLHAHYPLALIDAVDIDPEVARVAKDYFGFREDDRLRVHVEDGRRYIESVTVPYDAIFLDAFDSRDIPAHLTTVEFLRAVRRAVRPDGVVVSNVWRAPQNALYPAMVRTYRQVFETVKIVPVPSDVNNMVFALPRREAIDHYVLSKRTAMLNADKRLPFDPGAALNDPLPDEEQAIRNAPVLRDTKK